MAQVPYLSRADAKTREEIAIFDRLEAERKMPTPYIFRALANAPVQLDGLLTYARSLRQAEELGPRLRELIILSIAYAKGGAYIAAHHEEDALKAGLTADQLSAVRTVDASKELFTEQEYVVIKIGHAIGKEARVDDDMLEQVSRHLSPKQFVQLALTAAWYSAGNITTSLLGIDLEDEYDNSFRRF